MKLSELTHGEQDENILNIDEDIDVDEALAEIAVLGEYTSHVVSSQHGYIANDIDLEITSKDIYEALAFVQQVSAAGQMQLDEGESRSYLFEDAETGQNEIFVCDITSQVKKEDWAESYARGVAHHLSERIKNLWANVLNNELTHKQSMVIAGRAEAVGVAKEQFFAAMTMAGLKINNGRYEKVYNSNDLFLQRLKEHGFDCQISGTGTLDVSFSALNNIPVKHRFDAVKVVLRNLLNDYNVMDKLQADIVQEVASRPGYEHIKSVLKHYDIKEEGLYHILKQSISKKIIDPSGEISELLSLKYDLTSQLLGQQDGYRTAIKTLFESAVKCGTQPTELREVLSQITCLDTVEHKSLQGELNQLVTAQEGLSQPSPPAQPAEPATA